MAELASGQAKFVHVGDQIELIGRSSNHPTVRGEGDEGVVGEIRRHGIRLCPSPFPFPRIPGKARTVPPDSGESEADPPESGETVVGVRPEGTR